MAGHPCSGLNSQGKFRGYGRSRSGNFMRTDDYARCTGECWKEGKQIETNIIMTCISWHPEQVHA
eukprot:11825443-Heterocapsa_arctica.AAC.1